MVTLHVLRCRNPQCGRDTLLQPSFLEDIFQRRVPSSTGKETLNFVCPLCGNGYPYSLSDLPAQEFSYSPYALQDGPVLIHVSLKCGKEGCESHARVHTQAASGIDNTNLAKLLLAWTLFDITCFVGHPVRVPLEQPPSLLDKIHHS